MRENPLAYNASTFRQPFSQIRAKITKEDANAKKHAKPRVLCSGFTQVSNLIKHKANDLKLICNILPNPSWSRLHGPISVSR